MSHSEYRVSRNRLVPFALFVATKSLESPYANEFKILAHYALTSRKRPPRLDILGRCLREV